MNVVKEDLSNEEWFQLSCTREESERILNSTAINSLNFVVRKSSRPNFLALTYKSEKAKQIIHSLIEVSSKGYKLPDEDRQVNNK